MGKTYAVVWRKPNGPLFAGKLELGRSGLSLEGAGSGLESTHTVAYGDLFAVRVGRASTERLDGRPTLVLEQRSGMPLHIGSVNGPGVVHELAAALGALQSAKIPA